MRRRGGLERRAGCSRPRRNPRASGDLGEKIARGDRSGLLAERAVLGLVDAPSRKADSRRHRTGRRSRDLNRLAVGPVASRAGRGLVGLRRLYQRRHGGFLPQPGASLDRTSGAALATCVGENSGCQEPIWSWDRQRPLRWFSCAQIAERAKLARVRHPLAERPRSVEVAGTRAGSHRRPFQARTFFSAGRREGVELGLGPRLLEAGVDTRELLQRGWSRGKRSLRDLAAEGRAVPVELDTASVRAGGARPASGAG